MPNPLIIAQLSIEVGINLARENEIPCLRLVNIPPAAHTVESS